MGPWFSANPLSRLDYSASPAAPENHQDWGNFGSCETTTGGVVIKSLDDRLGGMRGKILWVKLTA